ncbi:uncharacterized protein [Asterias amurensis]|uniref:uncharacterized protein n=1 Tax=Asterias amurensis TaxID=7602 RepID=UPI003AB62537
MHSRSGLPTPRPPDDRKGGDEDKNEGRTRRVSGGSSSPKKDSSKTLVSRRGVKNKQSSQEVSVFEHGNREQHSIHSRIGQSSSIEDSYWSRNWNSEGGRPKRERALSDRPQSKRLLHRASLTSVGELIPFQRAPRDGSYESNLPHRKKSETKKQIKPDDRKESSNHEHRSSSKSNEPQSSDAVPSSSVGRQRRQGTNQSRATHLRNKDLKEKTVQPSRKLSSEKGSVAVNPMEHPQIGSERKNTITDTNNKTEGIESSDEPAPGVLTGVRNSTPNVANSLLQQHGGDSLSAQGSAEEAPQSSERHSTFQCSRTVSVKHGNDGESSNLRITKVNSPSAEFKQAAGHQQTRNSVTPSSQPKASASNSLSSTNLLPLNLNNISSPVPSTSSDVGHPEETSPRRPNSVFRRGRDSNSILEPNPSQLSQAFTSVPNSTVIRESPRTIMPHPPPMNTSQTSETRRDRSLSVNDESTSPRTNIAHPPNANLSLSFPSGPSATSSQQGRLNRFGRRVRVPSSSEPQESSNRPAQEEIRHNTSAEQTPEPVNETFEGTNRRRYRFFTLSQDLANEENQRSAIPLTPHRDVLYGSTSPPLLRRHMRTHFDSDHRETSRTSQGSVGLRSSLGSSISDDDLREDSFRTSSGGQPVFSPVLNSGPSLDSSLVQRQHILHADASVSPREISSLNSSPRELSRLSSSSREVSRLNSSPRELPILNASSRSQIRTRGELDIASSSDQEYLTFSVDEGRLSRDARRRHQNDRNDAIPRLLPQRSRETSRELSRSSQIMNDVFGSNTNQMASIQGDASSDLQVPLFGSPLFAPLGVPPGMLLSLLVRTRREFGQEFMELLLENMMLNVLAHHLFETDLQGNDDGINGAPPPATQAIIDNLNETPALEMHIAKEMKCSICHSEYELYETLAELPCTHFFHPTCVAIWLKKSGTCPVCRFDLTSPTK